MKMKMKMKMDWTEEMLFRLKKGADYYVVNHSKKYNSGNRTDDLFHKYLFPASIIETYKCDCDSKDCNTLVSHVDFFAERLISDADNFERVA